MKLLLDTHALIWWFLDSPRLPDRIKTIIEEPDADIFVSAASGWEITTKYRIGRFQEASELAKNFPDLVRNWRFEPLSVSLEHADLAGLLESNHRDPFDRMLAAQSRLENLPLASADPAMSDLGARVFW